MLDASGLVVTFSLLRSLCYRLSESVHRTIALEPLRVVLYSTSAEKLVHFRLPVARHLAEAGYEVIFASPPDDVGARLAESPFEYVPFESAARGSSPISDIVNGYRLAGLYRRVAPDIVHHFGARAVVQGGIAARSAELPWIVHSFPDLGGDPSARTWLRAGARTVLRWAIRDAEVTVHSAEDRMLLVSKNCVRPEHAHLLGEDVVDPETVPFDELADGAPVAAFVGDANREADLVAFVESVRRVRPEVAVSTRRAPRFAVIASESEISETTRRQIELWQEEGVVEWWPRQTVETALHNVHVVFAPACEEFGIRSILLTAATMGRPIVAIDSPASRAIVRHGMTGILVPRSDLGALDVALTHLLTDPDARLEMSRQARQFIENEYAARQVARQIMAVYQLLYERGREI